MKWIWIGVSLVVAIGVTAIAMGKKGGIFFVDKLKNNPKMSYPLPEQRVLFGKKSRGKAEEVGEEFILRGAEIWTAAGRIIHEGEILVRKGKIAEIGKKIDAPNAKVIDVRGKFITPGLIDAHSHMGVYPAVWMRGVSDGNEWVKPVTGYAEAENAFWPQDPALPKALAGGVTTILSLPGSANLIGGKGFVVKLKPSRDPKEMRFPGAPISVKMACGENPKRVHRSLATRMGNYAGFRRAFLKAREYMESWRRYREQLELWREKKREWAKKCAAKGKASGGASSRPTTAPAAQGKGKREQCDKFRQLPPRPPRKDINLETLAGILRGEYLPQIHCYRADDMLKMIRLADEFGFKIRGFHHSLEAYKIRDILAKKGIAAATWADWWGFKIEAYDGIQENAALLAEAGVRAVIHSDSSQVVQRLLQEAAKVFYRGRALGIKLGYDQVIRWVTANPAWMLGIDKYTGSIEEGKAADLVVWDRFPLSVYARPTLVFIDGEIVFDRRYGARPSDFALGLNLPF